MEFLNFERIVGYEEGWDFVEKGIKKLLKGLPKPCFTSEDCSMIYTTIYNMCTQNPPHDYSEQLYQKYKQTFEDYIKSTVLPSLQEKKDELLLKELLERWSDYKIMYKYLSRFFSYLDEYYISRRYLPSLEKSGFLLFYSLVYSEINTQVQDTILTMIDQKRAGKCIDDKLVNNILAFYLEIGEKTRTNEPKHFAETIIKENAAFNIM